MEMRKFLIFIQDENIFVFLFTAYITEKFIQNKLALKSAKNEPLGKNGMNTIVK